MSENTPDAPAENVEKPQEGEPEPFDAERAQQKIAKANAEAKNLRSRLKELEDQRKASMTEAERAVVEAEQRGRAAVLVEFGQRLARSAFVAAAARRNPAYDAAAVLDDLNLARYVGEDGEPDSKAIDAAVERLVPAASPATPGLPRPDPSQGATTPMPLNGDPIEKALRQKLGIT